MTHRKQHASCSRNIASSLLLGFLVASTGCQSFRSRSAEDDLAVTPISNPASIDNVKGPLERSLAGNRSQSIISSRSVSNTPEFASYEAAKQLYDAGNYNAAEDAFDDLAKSLASDDSGEYRRRTWWNWYKPLSERKSKYSDRPLREDALFMLAESRFAQEKYPGAEDVYLGLLKDYPSTRHLDVATKRLYDIALVWMEFKPTKTEDVQLAAYSDSEGYGRPQVVQNKDYDRPGFFNFTDKRRPKTDTEGRALEALKAIWLNDPTGPLADDALMLTASHYLRIGRHTEAAETYRMLRQEFPDSPYLKDAYLLGAYVTQASYQGAQYDSQNLNEARQLKLMALNIFPELSPEERAKVESELSQVDDAVVAREFELAIFYLRKGNFNAVEMYCYKIINQYPDSKYAGKARGLLTRLPEFKKQNTLVLALQGVSAEDIPSVDNMPAQPPVTAATPNNIAPTTPEPAPEEEETEKPKRFPSWSIPKLRPIPIPGFSSEPEEETEELEDAIPYQPSPGSEAQPGRVDLTLGQQPTNP